MWKIQLEIPQRKKKTWSQYSNKIYYENQEYKIEDLQCLGLSNSEVLKKLQAWPNSYLF